MTIKLSPSVFLATVFFTVNSFSATMSCPSASQIHTAVYFKNVFGVRLFELQGGTYNGTFVSVYNAKDQAAAQTFLMGVTSPYERYATKHSDFSYCLYAPYNNNPLQLKNKNIISVLWVD